MNLMQIVATALYGRSEPSVPSKAKRYEVSFIEGSRLLASTTWPSQRSHEQDHTPYSIAYFCDKCGEIWRRILVHENAEAWHCISRPCRRHTPQLSLLAGGTFYHVNFQEDFDIPKNVLAEDFLFLMSLFDKTVGSYEM